LEEQESLVSSHIDRFIQGLADNATKGPLDMMTWFVWLTFDIIGDLSFGESFGCLEKQDYHPWIKAIRVNIERSPWFQALGYYPSVLKMLLRNLPPSVEKARMTDYNLARAWVQKRLERGSREKPDFMSFLLKKDGTEDALQLNEYPPQMLAMVAAGSETTATLLPGVLALLSQHPSAKAKLVQEVRTAFDHEREIKLASTNKLEYLNAIISESLRLYPPVPTCIARMVSNPAGENIAGEWVPPNVGYCTKTSSMTATDCCHIDPSWRLPPRSIPLPSKLP